jgi:hypothetical protein
VDGFVKADLQPTASGGLRCDLHRNEADDLVVELDSLEHLVLNAWILNYERLSLAGDAVSQVLLGLLGADHPSDKLRAFSRLHGKGIIDVDRGRFEDPARPMIVTRSGDTLRRPLLTVSESALFVWDGDALYDASTADTHLRRIPADSIAVLKIRTSIPFGTAVKVAIYALWSGMLYWISRESTGNDKESIPVAAMAMVGPIPAAIPGLLLGWWASLPEYTLTYSTNEDSLAVKRGIPKLIPHSLFGTNVPPEFHSREVAGEGGMKVYGDGDSHPYEYIGCPDCESKWMLGLETLVHIYDVHKRPISTHVGLSLSRRIALTQRSGGKYEWYLALRPRLSAGTFLSAECSVELVSPDAVSFHAGLAYTHVFEELGTSTDGHHYTSYWTSSYERTSILQESFAVFGMSIARPYGNVELQLRHILQPALHSKVGSYNYDQSPLRYEETIFDIKGFWGGSIILNVRL